MYQPQYLPLSIVQVNLRSLYPSTAKNSPYRKGGYAESAPVSCNFITHFPFAAPSIDDVGQYTSV